MKSFCYIINTFIHFSLLSKWTEIFVCTSFEGKNQNLRGVLNEGFFSCPFVFLRALDLHLVPGGLREAIKKTLKKIQCFVHIGSLYKLKKKKKLWLFMGGGV